MQASKSFPKLPQATTTAGNYITSKSTTNSRREEISENAQVAAQVRELAKTKIPEPERLADWFHRRRRLLQLQTREILAKRGPAK